MTQTFAQAVTQRTQQLNTRLCLGLDPRRDKYRDFAHLKEHTLAVLEEVAPAVACLKPQLAFFEALGLAGMELLEEVCARGRLLGLPILLDGKRGDIGSTARAYAEGWLTGRHAGDALTVNPFLGFQTLQPFLQAALANDGAIFVLVKTSNPDQSDLQTPEISKKLALEITRLSAANLGDKEVNPYGAVGAVFGATHPQELPMYRALMPHSLLLLPGLGAQGAKATDLVGAFQAGGIGALASASRAIQYADGLAVGASLRAALTLRDELNLALETGGK